MFDLAAIATFQSGADDLVVQMDQFHRVLVPELLGEGGRADDVSKQNRADAGIAFVWFTAGEEDRAELVHLRAA